MHIESIGNGPDLVLVHGWAMHSGIFAPLTRLLAAHCTVHLVDLPGHGYSNTSQEPLDLATCAQKIAHKIPPAVWVGWSLGGLVCLQAALEHTPAVKGLVLIATSPRFVVGDDWPHGVAHETFAQFGEGLRANYYHTIERFLALEAHGSDHAQAELRELKTHVFERGEPALQVLEEGLQLLDKTDLRTELRRLQKPSLWISGRRDKLIPPAAMHWAAEQCPGGQYLEFSAGHAPFIGHAQTVATAIIEFVTRQSYA